MIRSTQRSGYYTISDNIQTLEKTERAIKNGQSRATGNTGYTRHRTKTTNTKRKENKKTKTIKQHRKLKKDEQHGDGDIVKF